MFDFPSAFRDEGDAPGINDKGLVTYDRKVKKDAFYFYKANWNAEPMIYITSKRYDHRGTEPSLIKIYSNLPQVELIVNGVSMGLKKSTTTIFSWENIALREGWNHIEATGLRENKKIADSCSWYCSKTENQ
jgi:beta-galactosidase